MSVTTVFEGIPDYFVERYDFDWRRWGSNFKQHGLNYRVLVREGGLADLSPNAEQGPVMLAVDLTAEIERRAGSVHKITIKVADEQSRQVMLRHCEKMQRAGIRARSILVEPPRAGIPFLPKFV
jgi:hypothetical protein